MLTFNSKFAAELKKGKSDPTTIMHLQESIFFDEKALQADWIANSSENNVDYTPSPPVIGDVILASDTPPDEENLTGNTWSYLRQVVYVESLRTIDITNIHWQSFKQNAGVKDLGIVKGYFKKSTHGEAWTAKCSIWDSAKTMQYGSTIAVSVTSTSGEWLSFDFSSQEIDIADSTEYWLKFEAVIEYLSWIDGDTFVQQKYQNTNVYADGQFDRTGSSPGTDLGDLMFEVSFIGDYYQPNGHITTDNFDLGSVPTVNGEWKIGDVVPSETSLTYEGWSSATGVFDIWNEYFQTGSYPSARQGFASCIVGDDLYMFGGYDGSGLLNELWKCDLSSVGKIWTQLTSGATTRDNTTLVADGGKLYVFGGWNGSTGLNDLYEYTISTDSWFLNSPSGTPPAARRGHIAVVVSGKMYIHGGLTSVHQKDIHIYDISGNSWASLTSGNTERYGHIAEVSGGKIYVYAGWNTSTGALNSVEEYSISGDSWVNKTSGGTAANLRASVLYNDKIYVYGGNTGSGRLSSTFEYDISGDSWTTVKSGATARSGHAGVLHGDKMYILGGYDGTAEIADLWSYGTLGGDAVSLGIVVDGDAITDLERYYRVRASFTSNPVRDKTPILSSITADFAEYLKIDKLKTMSALTTTIDLFEESTISQMTITLALTAATSNWMAVKKPRNKRVKMFIGFNAEGFTENDFEKFYFGSVAAADITSNDEVKISVEGFAKDWKEDIPNSWEDAGDDITWTNEHPIDVMLDIYRQYLPVRDSALVLSSFDDVKAEILDWVVTRTITDNPIEGKKLLEELRKLMSSFFIPQPDGSVKIKRWDPNEAAVSSITDLQLMSKNYKGNYRKIINRLYVYFDWSGSGDDTGDFNDVLADTRAGSKADYGKWETETIKDKWTKSAQITQIQDRSTKLLDRYEDPPPLLPVTVDLKNLAIEEGDIIEVTTKRAPSTDMSGISAKRFQVVKRQINWQKKTLDWELLAVTG